MNEQAQLNDSREGSADNANPERNGDSFSGERTSQADSSEEIARFAAIFKAMNRPLIPPELVAIFKAMNRPLIPPELVATFKAMNRPLIPPELVATFKAMNRPLIPPELAKSLAATFKAMNRPLIPPELVKSLAATGLRPRTRPATQSGKPLAIQKAGLRDVDGRSMRRYEEPRFWSDSEAVLVDNVSFTEETCYWLIPFDALVTDDGLRQTCRSLFNGDHYALAVQKAFTYIDNMVRDKSGQAEKYGADLMRTVFSAKSPVLRLNDLETLSDRNEQQGYMEMLAGAMIGIRNPRSHEYDFVDRPEEALEMLVMANHFIRMLNKATPT
jgi:uncharacterized protein (TIGR02391 family)